MPPDSLFEEGGFECGPVGAVAHSAGSGLGSLAVDPRSNPRDAWTIAVRCSSAGELNSNFVNPGPQPTFQVSFDGGATWWWRPYSPDAKGLLKVVKGGFSLQLQNGTVGAPVTVGTGTASLVLTPLRAGGSIEIVTGTTLGQSFFDGALVLTVTSATTSEQAAAYLAGFSAITDYFAIAAGGNGSGVVQAAAQTSLPFASFTTQDIWTFTTAPSPDVVSAQQAAFDFLNGRWRSSFRFPLLAWDTAIEMCEAVYTRWFLIRRRGLDRHQDFRVYDPALFEEGKPFCDGVANGQIHPVVTQSSPGATLFADQVRQIDPLSPEAGSFLI